MFWEEVQPIFSCWGGKNVAYIFSTYTIALFYVNVFFQPCACAMYIALAKLKFTYTFCLNIELNIFILNYLLNLEISSNLTILVLNYLYVLSD